MKLEISEEKKEKIRKYLGISAVAIISGFIGYLIGGKEKKEIKKNFYYKHDKYYKK